MSNVEPSDSTSCSSSNRRVRHLGQNPTGNRRQRSRLLDDEASASAARPSASGGGRRKRFRHWVFTLNNWVEEDVTRIDGLVAAGNASFVAYQPEVGESGTRHLQGILSFDNPRELGGVVGLFRRDGGPSGVHAEDMRGTFDQAFDYTRKDESRDPDAGFGHREFGTRPRSGTGHSGARSDLAELAAAAQSEPTLRGVAERFPGAFIQHFRGVSALRSVLGTPRTHKTEVFWYFGSTGSGKSREAFELCPTAYVKMGANKWWDGYDAHEDVIIDDYRTNLCPFAQLLQLLDRYAMKVEYKGGSCEFVAKRVFITTSLDPVTTWCNREDGDLNQLVRRITCLKCFTPDEQFCLTDPDAIKEWSVDVIEERVRKEFVAQPAFRP